MSRPIRPARAARWALTGRRSVLRLTLTLAVVAQGLAACAAPAHSGAAGTSGTSRTSSTGGPAGGSTGCHAAPTGQAAGSTTEQQLESGGQRRTFRLHLPADYSPSRADGLVLAFHGRGETDAQLETYSGLDRLPMVVAYPQGLPGTAGQPGWQGTPYAAPQVDDVGFAGALLAHLEATLCLDPTRIGATGKSDGGGFAALLGCRLPGIGAVAAVSGAFYQTLSTCHPPQNVAVLNFHGGNDTVVPYDGDARRGLLPVAGWLAGWVTRDSCTPQATTFYAQNGVVAEQWSGCSHGVVVQNYRIDSGGHTWTGSTQRSGPGGNTSAINATDLIGAFFAAH